MIEFKQCGDAGLYVMLRGLLLGRVVDEWRAGRHSFEWMPGLALTLDQTIDLVESGAAEQIKQKIKELDGDV